MNKFIIFTAINDRAAILPDKSTTKVGFLSDSHNKLPSMKICIFATDYMISTIVEIINNI